MLRVRGMAPNLALRSDSWLDLSAAVRSYASLSSVRTEAATSSSGHYGARKLAESSFDNISAADQFSSQRSSASSQQQNKHLLIRMRQSSFRANRSQSTTLSSSQMSSSCQLSNTSELSSSLAEALVLFDPENCTLESSATMNEQETSCMRSHRKHNRTTAIRTSPFVRSWSSFSGRLSGQFSQLRHTCKHLLQRYHERTNSGGGSKHDGDEDRAPLDRHVSVPPEAVYRRPELGRNKQRPLERRGSRMRLTEDWVANHRRDMESVDCCCGCGQAGNEYARPQEAADPKR